MSVRPDPRRRRAERLADAVVHAVGGALGIAACAALGALALPKADFRTVAALAPYAGGLLAMLGCSALYNLAPEGRWKRAFRRLDHAAIFVMIAGTYTPFALLAMGGPEGLALLAFVWAVALGGVALKLGWPGRLERVSIVLYLALGWSALAALEPLAAALSPAGLILLATGGALYTVGVVFHLWERLPYQTAIWHGFVLAGAAAHYAAVLGDVLA